MRIVALLAAALALGALPSEADGSAAGAELSGHPAVDTPRAIAGSPRRSTAERWTAASPALADPGCYRLEVGAWRPAMEPARSPIFRLPDRVVLEAVRVAGGGERSRFLLRSSRPELQRTGRAAQAYWSVRENGTLALHWTTGVVGVDIELRGTGRDRYVGTARAWSNQGAPGRPGATTSVVALRERCGG